MLVVTGHLVRPMVRLPIPLTPELYTASPPYRDFIRADPLRLLEATIQFFWQTGRLDRRRRTAAARLELPVLLLQGEDDQMMDVPATRRWFDGLGGEGTSYRPIRAPATPWTSSPTGLATWATCWPGCRPWSAPGHRRIRCRRWPSLTCSRSTSPSSSPSGTPPPPPGGGLGVQVDLAALQGYVVDQASVI
jgi:hypothetical protein